jgi:hypothetical protein
MARTKRTEEQKQADRDLVAEKKSEDFKKILKNEVLGKSFWCHTREQQIQGPVCQKMQTTAGCPAGLENCPLWDSKANLKAETKPGSKKAKSGKLSYQVIMKAHFLEFGVATLPELVDLINNHPSRKNVDRKADNKNVSVGVSILKNPKRMKNPLNISFSRLTGRYYCFDLEGTRELMAEEEATEKTTREEAKKAEKESTPEPEGKLYKDMTVKELKVEAEKLGVDPKGLKKAELLTAVQEAKHIELEGGPQ